jgi:hypothetical protein
MLAGPHGLRYRMPISRHDVAESVARREFVRLMEIV